MRLTVVLPSALRELADDRPSVALDADAATVGEALRALREANRPLHDRIVTERGEVRPHLNLYVGREDIRWTGGLDTPVTDGSEVLVLRSVSGG